MNSAEYWKGRFELIEKAKHNRGIECYADIENQFKAAEREIEAKISTWYQRFMDNNKVTMQEARKMLTKKELDELKWDVNEYIKHGIENGINGQWAKQLENASVRFHISRYEAIKLQLQQQVERLYGNQLDSIDSAMRDIYIDGYYRSAYEIQKGMSVGYGMMELDERRIDKIINKPWAQDGKNFSDRVWANKSKLVGELNTTLTRGIILGKEPKKTIDEMSRKLNVSKFAAGRLVMTESAAFSEAAKKDCFNDLDVEKYEISATLDSHTSDICQDMDGKVFNMSEWEVGVTAPPFHVFCRSTTIPYFDDDFGLEGKRAVKGEDGKTYYVPADMSYKEWKEKFVVKNAKSDMIKPTMKDITNEWKKVSHKNMKEVKDLTEYEVNGVVYKIDGKHVLLDYSKYEKEVANIFANEYGREVNMIPRISYPQGVSTADYLVNGVRYDLKTPQGNGKNTLYNMVKSKKRQANNFIINLDKTDLPIEEVLRQNESIFSSSHTAYVEEVIYIKNKEVIKAFRKK